MKQGIQLASLLLLLASSLLAAHGKHTAKPYLNSHEVATLKDRLSAEPVTQHYSHTNPNAKRHTALAHGKKHKGSASLKRDVRQTARDFVNIFSQIEVEQPELSNPVRQEKSLQGHSRVSMSKKGNGLLRSKRERPTQPHSAEGLLSEMQRQESGLRNSLAEQARDQYKQQFLFQYRQQGVNNSSVNANQTEGNGTAGPSEAEAAYSTWNAFWTDEDDLHREQYESRQMNLFEYMLTLEDPIDDLEELRERLAEAGVNESLALEAKRLKGLSDTHPNEKMNAVQLNEVFVIALILAHKPVPEELCPFLGAHIDIEPPPEQVGTRQIFQSAEEDSLDIPLYAPNSTVSNETVGARLAMLRKTPLKMVQKKPTGIFQQHSNGEEKIHLKKDHKKRRSLSKRAPSHISKAKKQVHADNIKLLQKASKSAKVQSVAPHENDKRKVLEQMQAMDFLKGQNSGSQGKMIKGILDSDETLSLDMNDMLMSWAHGTNYREKRIANA